MLRRLIVGFVGLAAACDVRDDDDAGPLTLEIDPVFDASGREAIARATAEWNARSTRKLRIVEDGGEWLVLRAAIPDGHLGYAQQAHRLVRIELRATPEQVYPIALHELGHALGLNHVERGVMDPTRLGVEFSDADLGECRRARACR